MIVGDYNIAPTDADVWNPESWKGNILVSEPERSALKTLLAAGLTDTWNLELHDPETYSLILIRRYKKGNRFLAAPFFFIRQSAKTTEH